MKPYPQNTEEWADEAFDSLKVAWTQLNNKFPFPTDKQKEQLVEIAAGLACDNREIFDLSFRAHAVESANHQFLSDYNSRDIGFNINYSLCYVLAYFDAHISLSMIPEEEAESAINYLRTNYDLTYEGKMPTNVLSIDFSTKQ